MQRSRRSSVAPRVVLLNRSGMPTRSRMHHAGGIAINVSDSFSVHHRSTLQCRIFLTPGLHALFGGLAAVIGPSRGLVLAAFAFRGPSRHSGWDHWLGRTAMRQNALLRSDKGLDVPSTARKKDTKVAKVSVVKPIVEDDRHDHFAVRKGVRCAGVHLILDLHGGTGLNDIDLIEATLRSCVAAAGATLLHIHQHHFQPSGVSGVAVLAESHISIHTWPEAGYAALDIFMCGEADPDACIPVLREAFKASRVEVEEILRGRDV